MKFIKQYIEEKYFLQTNGRVTLKHVCDDAGLDGVKVCINNVETGLFISQAEYDEWVDSMFDEMIKSKNDEKITYKVAPRFKVGDWIVGSNSMYKVVSLNDELSCYMVIDVNNEKIKIPYYFDCGPNHMCSYHLWTIRDARDGDVLVYQNGDTEIIMIFKSERDSFHAYTHFHVFDNNYGVNISCVCCIGAHPATKEQRDILFAKMKEAGYEWDADKKELKKIEQKSLEQSEDKKMRRCISDVVRKYGAEFTSGTVTKETMLAWLEKQGEQKPVWSDEDEEIQHALISTVERLTNYPTKWYFWLKSLKDRVQPQQKQGEHKPAIDVPSEELIFSIWDLGNRWKEITKGFITKEHGTQMDYIQKHWHESDYSRQFALLKKQREADNNN